MILVIGMLELVGGLSGCAAVLWFYFSGYQGGIPPGNVQATLLPFAVLTTAGVALLQERRLGLLLSFILQVCQAVAVTAWGNVWRFSAGPFFSVTFYPETTTVFAGWDTSFRIGPAPADSPAFLSINLLAALLAAILWRHIRKPRRAVPPGER